LKGKVFEATNPDNDGYNAEIEEFWIATTGGGEP